MGRIAFKATSKDMRSLVSASFVPNKARTSDSPLCGTADKVCDCQTTLKRVKRTEYLCSAARGGTSSWNCSVNCIQIRFIVVSIQTFTNLKQSDLFYKVKV